MRWCKNCVEPDTRPGQVFDKSGICTPCQYSLQKVPVKWEERRKELTNIVNWAKKNKKGKYDCVLGVSGGKDSLKLAYFAREFGLNPLLTCATFIPQHMSDLGAYNLSNIVNCGFDLETINVAPETCRKLMKITFLKFGNWVKTTEMFLISSMPRMAITHGIPLACGGENPFVTAGSECGSLDGDATNFAMLNTIAGGDLSHFEEEGYDPNELYFYQVPDKDEIIKNKIKFIYLGYYMEDFFASANYRFAIKRGMKTRSGYSADPINTGCVHDFVSLDEDFNSVNQHFKYLKYGFGFTAQQLSHDIREGLISREEAVELVKKYDGKCSEYYIDTFCDLIDISRKQFEEKRDQFRNRDIWMLDNRGNWVHRIPLE